MNDQRPSPKITTEMMSPVRTIQIPPRYQQMCAQNGTSKNILLRTWGGLGDQICTEPTIRYALKAFRKDGCEVTLASERPELFRHLVGFKRIFDLKEERPVYEKYNVFNTILPMDESNLFWLFVGHCITHCVDYSSMCALRMQLPVADREVVLVPDEPPKESPAWLSHLDRPWVVVHPGKHWPSKTFPKDWWDDVLTEIRMKGATPVIIGANTDDNRSTVDVETKGCIDLRDKLSVMESVWLLQNSRVLLTNDSAPLHMAVTGDAWVGFCATCKHPDYITHWRQGKWGWRMKNFTSDDISSLISYCPNQDCAVITVEHIEEKVLRSWLPAPHDYAEWAVEKASGAEE
jgi:hypothetical protein